MTHYMKSSLVKLRAPKYKIFFLEIHIVTLNVFLTRKFRSKYATPPSFLWPFLSYLLHFCLKLLSISVNCVVICKLIKILFIHFQES